MKITRERIIEDLGLKPNYDLGGKEFFWLEGRGHFYRWDTGNYYFLVDEMPEVSKGIIGKHIVTDWETLEEYL